MNDIRRYLSIARLLIASVLIVLLTFSIGIKNIISTFENVRPEQGICLVCCLALLLLIGSLNIWLLLRTVYPVPFRTYLKAYFYSWTISLVTPGQSGDASLVFLLKKNGIPMRYTGTAYTIDKILTLVFFFFIAWYGSYNLIPELKSIWFPVFCTGLILLVLIYFTIKLFPETIPLTEKFKKIFNAITVEAKNFKKKWHILIINLILTVMKWLVLSLCYMIAFLAFDVYVEWPEIGIIPVLSTLVGYIPVSIGGIGTVELTATHLFSKIGVEQSVVLSAYLLLRSLQFIMAFVLLLFFSSKKSDYKRKMNINQSHLSS